MIELKIGTYAEMALIRELLIKRRNEILCNKRRLVNHKYRSVSGDELAREEIERCHNPLCEAGRINRLLDSIQEIEEGLKLEDLNKKGQL